MRQVWVLVDPIGRRLEVRGIENLEHDVQVVGPTDSADRGDHAHGTTARQKTGVDRRLDQVALADEVDTRQERASRHPGTRDEGMVRGVQPTQRRVDRRSITEIETEERAHIDDRVGNIQDGDVATQSLRQPRGGIPHSAGAPDHEDALPLEPELPRHHPPVSRPELPRLHGTPAHDGTRSITCGY